MGRIALGFHPYAQDAESVKALVAEIRKHWDGPLWADEFGIPGGNVHDVAAQHSALLESLWRLGVEGAAVFPWSPSMHDGFAGLVDHAGNPNEIYAAVASAADALYHPPPGDVGTVVQGLDVASYQPTDLSVPIQGYGVGHVVVRFYLPWEQPSPDHTRQQVDSVRANGATVGGYAWPYRDVDPQATAWEFMQLAAACGVDLPVAWLDFEDYAGVVPTIAESVATLRALEDLGAVPGSYTSPYMMSRYFGNTTAFAPWLNWTAYYNGVPEFDVPAYCGWTVEQIVGKQFTVEKNALGQGYALDRDVFLSSAT